MAFVITPRAFRFTVNGQTYALDIFADGIVYDEVVVHLLVEKPEGWHRLHAEMEPAIIVNQAAVDAAGGIVKFCQQIVEKVNRALRIVFGDVGDGDIPPSDKIHEQVMDHLRERLRVIYTNGTPQLALD